MKKESINENASIQTLNIFFIVYVLVELVFKCLRADSSLDALINLPKTYLVSYLQWFWIIFSLYAAKDLKQKVFHKEYLHSSILKAGVITGSLVVSGYVFLQILGIIPIHAKGVLGILSQPYTSSGLILCTIFLLLESVDKKKKYWIYIFIFVLTLFVLSQLASIFAFILAFLYLIIKSKIINAKSALITILSFAVLVSLVFLISPKTKKRLVRKLDRLTSIEKVIDNKSLNCRLQMWSAGLKKTSENLFSGFHQEDFICHYRNKEILFDHVHNIYLQKLFDGGILRFLAWLSLYGAIAFMLFSLDGTYAIKSLFIAMSIEGMLENWWSDSEVFTLFVFISLYFIISKKVLQRV